VIPKTQRAFSRRRYKITRSPKIGMRKRAIRLWISPKMNSGASVPSQIAALPNRMGIYPSGPVNKLFKINRRLRNIE